MKRSKEPQVRRLPVKVSGAKVGVPSYKGQDSGKPAQTPAAEARSNLDAKPTLAFVPTLDDPSKEVSVTVLPSSSARVHTDASFHGNDGRKDGTPR